MGHVRFAQVKHPLSSSPGCTLPLPPPCLCHAAFFPCVVGRWKSCSTMPAYAIRSIPMYRRVYQTRAGWASRGQLGHLAVAPYCASAATTASFVWHLLLWYVAAISQYYA